MSPDVSSPTAAIVAHEQVSQGPGTSGASNLRVCDKCISSVVASIPRISAWLTLFRRKVKYKCLHWRSPYKSNHHWDLLKAIRNNRYALNVMREVLPAFIHPLRRSRALPEEHKRQQGALPSPQKRLLIHLSVLSTIIISTCLHSFLTYLLLLQRQNAS